LESWESLPDMFYTSSKKREGMAELQRYIHALNEQYYDLINP